MNKHQRKALRYQRKVRNEYGSGAVVCKNGKIFEPYNRPTNEDTTYLGVSAPGAVGITDEDRRLYAAGVLGVASSVGTLMNNIQRILDNPERYLLHEDLEEVLKNPSIAWGLHDMAYLPDCGKKVIETNVRGSGTIAEMEERALRNLAYRILREGATHGTNYDRDIRGNAVIMRATPVIITLGM